MPAAAQAKLADARAAAEAYINGYNLRAHHLLARDGRRLFRPKLRLISHWNLRDELKGAYADADGLDRQRIIAAAMDAIVRQTIPAAVIDNPALDWTPETGAVAVSPVKDDAPLPGAATTASTTREADVRYARWKGLFDAEREIDRFTPDFPTFIDRKFEIEREIPAAEVEQLLRAVLEAPVGARVASLISARLKRPLEPHDIWYAGFKPSAGISESALDAKTRERYPTAEAFAKDLPRILTGLGFTPERARFLADRVAVEPSRGSGHALGARMRDDKAHLRTRVNADGMDYKGYNIAVHELGHNIEQVFSVTTIDHTLLQGVPNNSFTEALAFLFQQQDMALLGMPATGAGRDAEAVLEAFWNAREIAGVSLVDIGAWRWLYAHPDASPAEFREAVVQLAQEVWNRYYASLHGKRDVTLLAIYSHMVNNEMYTPDYTLAHLVAFQIRAHFDKLGGPMGKEFERVAQIGTVTPNEWMRQAVGAPLSATPLVQAAESRRWTPACKYGASPTAALLAAPLLEGEARLDLEGHLLLAQALPHVELDGHRRPGGLDAVADRRVVVHVAAAGAVGLERLAGRVQELHVADRVEDRTRQRQLDRRVLARRDLGERDGRRPQLERLALLELDVGDLGRLRAGRRREHQRPLGQDRGGRGGRPQPRLDFDQADRAVIAGLRERPVLAPARPGPCRRHRSRTSAGSCPRRARRSPARPAS